MSLPVHNLKLETYTLHDLLELFQLSPDLTLDDLKRAKKMVCAMHPDKSRLPSEYFMFFKEAFHLLTTFVRSTVTPRDAPETKRAVMDALHRMSAKEFHRTFNALYEQHMVSPTTTDTSWFTDPARSPPTVHVTSINDLHVAVDALRSTPQGALQLRTAGPASAMTSSTSAAPLYDDADPDAYIACDSFGKLKYDDLRKVHRDETIFRPVTSEPRTSTTVQGLQHERSHPLPTPVSCDWDAQESARRHRMMDKAFRATLESAKQEHKQQTVMSHFLRLGH